MFTLKKIISRFETQADRLIEKFMIQHRFLGILMIFTGIPLITLAAVCACTTMIIVPIAFVFGLM